MIKKTHIVLLIIVIAFVLAFDALALTSVAKYAKYFSMALSAVGFGIFGFYFRKFPKIIRQFGVLFTLLLVISIISANLIHNQSYFSGIIASSSITIVGSSFLIYYLLIKYSISLETAKRSILTASWVFLVFIRISLCYSHTISQFFWRKYFWVSIIKERNNKLRSNHLSNSIL